MIEKIYNFFKRKDQVTTIEAQKYKNEDKFVLPKYDGMWTVKNVNSKTGDDLFYWNEGQNLIKGYLESSNVKSINLIDGRQKIVKSICNSFYHSLIDDMSELLQAIKKYPEADILIDISELEPIFTEHPEDWDSLYFFIDCFKKEGKKVTCLSFKEYQILYLDNFILANFMFDTGKKTTAVYDFIKKYVRDPDVKPTKNVIVSRALTQPRAKKDIEGLSFSTDTRLDDHIALEDYFASLGYDIIHAEKFKSFEEQINYFYSAKTIISLTGSGLANAAFMQPGGTLVEFVTPLVVPIAPPDAPKDITDPFYVQEIHNFYKNLAFYHDHIFLSIENSERSFEKIKNRIEDDPKLKAFLNRNE